MQLYVLADHGRREVGQLTAGPAHRGMNVSRKNEKKRNDRNSASVFFWVACLAFLFPVLLYRFTRCRSRPRQLQEAPFLPRVLEDADGHEERDGQDEHGAQLEPLRQDGADEPADEGGGGCDDDPGIESSRSRSTGGKQRQKYNSHAQKRNEGTARRTYRGWRRRRASASAASGAWTGTRGSPWPAAPPPRLCGGCCNGVCVCVAWLRRCIGRRTTSSMHVRAYRRAAWRSRAGPLGASSWPRGP